MSRSMSIIQPENLAAAKEKGGFRLRQERRRASTLRALGENLDGAYITKRLEPKLAAMFPDARRVYLSAESFTDWVVLNVAYPDVDSYDDYIQVRMCRANERRLDGKSMLEQAEQAEADLRRRESRFSLLDEAAAAYNSLADSYAKLWPYLKDFLYNDVPGADYCLAEQYKDEPFPARQTSAPLPDPIPLPVQTSAPLRFTFEEFAAMVSGS